MDREGRPIPGTSSSTQRGRNRDRSRSSRRSSFSESSSDGEYETADESAYETAYEGDDESAYETADEDQPRRIRVTPDELFALKIPQETIEERRRVLRDRRARTLDAVEAESLRRSRNIPARRADELGVKDDFRAAQNDRRFLLVPQTHEQAVLADIFRGARGRRRHAGLNLWPDELYPYKEQPLPQTYAHQLEVEDLEAEIIFARNTQAAIRHFRQRMRNMPTVNILNAPPFDVLRVLIQNLECMRDAIAALAHIIQPYAFTSATLVRTSPSLFRTFMLNSGFWEQRMTRIYGMCRRLVDYYLHEGRLDHLFRNTFQIVGHEVSTGLNIVRELFDADVEPNLWHRLLDIYTHLNNGIRIAYQITDHDAHHAMSRTAMTIACMGLFAMFFISLFPISLTS